jgi:hypothetical protein
MGVAQVDSFLQLPVFQTLPDLVFFDTGLADVQIAGLS